jgi:hypothetical protein
VTRGHSVTRFLSNHLTRGDDRTRTGMDMRSFGGISTLRIVHRLNYISQTPGEIWRPPGGVCGIAHPQKARVEVNDYTPSTREHYQRFINLFGSILRAVLPRGISRR